MGTERPLKIAHHRREAWRLHVLDWNECTQCLIGRMARNHVFARGALPCEILFVGEAPGKTEDATGWPFVGKCGQMLDDWMMRAFTIMAQKMPGRELATPAYAIANIVLCRPCDTPGGPNRAPSLQEIANCKPRLDEFIREVARPKAIVCIGKFAENHRTWTGIPTLAIRHPGYVLRLWNPEINQRVQAEQIEKLASFIRKEFYGKIKPH